jgi:hypothetical protein
MDTLIETIDTTSTTKPALNDRSEFEKEYFLNLILELVEQVMITDDEWL